MILEALLGLVAFVLTALPVLALPAGASSALAWLSAVIGYVNIFIPVAQLVPMFLLIVAIRNWNIIWSIIRFVFRFVPFIGGD